MKKNTLGFVTHLLLKMNFEDIIWFETIYELFRNNNQIK